MYNVNAGHKSNLHLKKKLFIFSTNLKTVWQDKAKQNIFTLTRSIWKHYEWSWKQILQQKQGSRQWSMLKRCTGDQDFWEHLFLQQQKQGSRQWSMLKRCTGDQDFWESICFSSSRNKDPDSEACWSAVQEIRTSERASVSPATETRIQTVKHAEALYRRSGLLREHLFLQQQVSESLLQLFFSVLLSLDVLSQGLVISGVE